MTKLNLRCLLIHLTIAVSLISCNKGNKLPVESVDTEVLPEDIVELRADQIKLAKVELGAVEMRSLGNIIKVNGKILA